MQLTIIYTQEPEWGYTAQVVELPWCVSYWETIEKAEKMITEASEAYIESIKKHEDKESFYQKHSFISSIILNETVFAWWNNQILA